MFGNVLTAPSGAASYSSIIFLVLIFVVFYFFLIRPENKKKKELASMRDSLSLGDEIVTIGGMMGKIVQVTNETITFETGEDRVRIQVQKWAISTNVRVEKAKAAQQQAQPSGGLFGKKKAKEKEEEKSSDE